MAVSLIFEEYSLKLIIRALGGKIEVEYEGVLSKLVAINVIVSLALEFLNLKEMVEISFAPSASFTVTQNFTTLLFELSLNSFSQI